MDEGIEKEWDNHRRGVDRKFGTGKLNRSQKRGRRNTNSTKNRKITENRKE